MHKSIDGSTEIDWPPSFSLDQERVLELLTGDRFYSNASAALREAILNAIDAVNRCRLNDTSVRTEIRVTFNADQLSFSVSDNGDGMDRASVNDLFTRVGASASNMQRNGAVGEFGIGVISYFMAGDSFDLQTYDDSNDPIGLKFTRDMLTRGSAEPIKVTQLVRGTTVTIYLRNQETYQVLLNSFSHWCRDVDGLTAIELPENRNIPQGDSARPTPVADLPAPEWVERAHLGTKEK